MRVQRLQWLFPILCITLSACSTSQGFDRSGMQDTLHQRLNLVGEPDINTPETKNAMESNPALAGPFRLGVYFVRTEFPTRQSLHSVEWLSAEKDQLVQRLTQLHSDRILREIMVLAEPTVRTLTRQELRQASVRYGIDVLLVIDGVGAVDRHNNAYALLYPTLLGAWLAPGTVIDALFILDGTLWDLRTDKLLNRQTAEGQAQRTGAVVLVEDADVLREAKHRAIETFGTGLVQHLRSLPQTRSDAPAALR
jgi:rhombotail lipoprotein